MIALEQIQKLYCIGIGGIGMSALARYFSSLGKQVSGYDRSRTPLTIQLEQEGIRIVYEDAEELAPREVDLIVYTPAVPSGHPQLAYYRGHGYTVMKRSEVLGLITASSFNIGVAGTHGKTTISTLIAFILRHSGYGCNAFLGGISANYHTNFWSSSRNVCVIEADEYDRSFLQLSPDIAVISAMDADHLDIYGTEKAMQDAFVAFSGKVKPGGLLLVKKGLPRESEWQTDRVVTYSLSDPDSQVQAQNLRVEQGSYVFNIKLQQELVEGVRLNMGGLHNVENTCVAVAVARELGITADAIRLAVDAFRGVRRRFEYIVKTPGMVYIDDYAHHPEELKMLIGSARSLFASMRCTVIFQPHLYSRTRDLAGGFAKSLDGADEVILLPVYPARELPVEGVSSRLIQEKMQNKQVRILEKDELLHYIRNMPAGLLITAGAGDIDALVGPVSEILNKRNDGTA